VIHYIWLVKADLKKPLEYAFVLALLILYRLIVWIATRKGAAGVPPTVEPASRALTG
jgi:DMSO/TMAO reductase YedYZ heme-binding membrane subunit